MERSKAKEAGRKKLVRDRADALKDKPPRKAPTKEAIKQAGRYHAIDTVKKQLNEAQQAIAPDQEEQPYTAVDKVESYTANVVHEVIQPPDHPPHRQRGNVSHRETHSPDSQPSKASTPKERMRREAIKEVRKEKAEAAQHGPQNVSHGETHSNAPQPLKAISTARSARKRRLIALKSRSPTWQKMIFRLFRIGVRLYGKSRPTITHSIAEHARKESKSRGSVKGRCPVILPQQEHLKRRSSRSRGADMPATRRSRRSKQAPQKVRLKLGMSLFRSSAQLYQELSGQALMISLCTSALR